MFTVLVHFKCVHFKTFEFWSFGSTKEFYQFLAEAILERSWWSNGRYMSQIHHHFSISYTLEKKKSPYLKTGKKKEPSYRKMTSLKQCFKQSTNTCGWLGWFQFMIRSTEFLCMIYCAGMFEFSLHVVHYL